MDFLYGGSGSMSHKLLFDVQDILQSAQDSTKVHALQMGVPNRKSVVAP